MVIFVAAAHGASLRGGSDGSCDSEGSLSDGGSVVLSARPLIVYYPNFISDAEIGAILAKGGPKLKPSRTDAGLFRAHPADVCADTPER